MSEVKRAVELGNLLVRQQAKVDRLTEELRSAKEDMLRTEREDLPDLLREIGLNSFTLEDGTVISIKEEVSAAITEKTKGAALSWLIEHGFGGLIKTEVLARFGRGDHETAMAFAQRISQDHQDVELKEVVHPGTLKSFVKEQMEKGEAIPMDLFNIHPYDKAIIDSKGKAK